MTRYFIPCSNRECVNGYVRGEYHELCGGTGIMMGPHKPNHALRAAWSTILYAGVATLAAIVAYFIVR